MFSFHKRLSKVCGKFFFQREDGIMKPFSFINIQGQFLDIQRHFQVPYSHKQKFYHCFYEK